MLFVVCSLIRSFTYCIFAVVYFGYDKSLLYLNSSICKVINFSLSLSLSLIPKKTSNQLKWTTRYTCHKSIYYLIVYCECLLSRSFYFFLSHLKRALFRVFVWERWCTHSISQWPLFSNDNRNHLISTQYEDCFGSQVALNHTCLSLSLHPSLSTSSSFSFSFCVCAQSDCVYVYTLCT